MITLKEKVDNRKYVSEDGVYTMQREGDSDRWHFRRDFVLIDVNHYRMRIAERHDLRLVSIYGMAPL